MKNQIFKIFTLILFVSALTSCTVGYRNGYQSRGDRHGRYHDDGRRVRHGDPSRYNPNHY